MTFESRTESLRDLIAARQPLAKTISHLRTFPWDSDRILVEIGRLDVVRVLRRYLQAELSVQQCVEWAEAIEARDDVGFEVQHTDELKRFIFEVANPELCDPLSHEAARNWITWLEDAGPMVASPDKDLGNGRSPG